ncbi:energy transducer TonB [Chryseobacterium cheonjiense]|uniref:Energy transducer TonB n=1 Tax=Chryseobacterium cheonjiense TaxID=2728845 RepID=A0A7Y0AAB1_9FLAO|nr:energy transducer TonB [Chryseobacterium cheonjiense]NML59311.1 energy transducer TonB [Chryseobacterium cheonjiense]
MKHMHQNQEFRFNEVLFEHRNKQYGAYVLRNESDRILTKALFIGVSFLAAVSFTPLIINAFKSEPIALPNGVEINLKDPVIPDDVIVPPKPQPVPQTTQPAVKTYDSTIKTPSRNAPDTNTEKIPDDAVAGLTNNFKADPAPPHYVPTAPTINTGPVSVPTPPRSEVKPVDGNAVSVVVDVEANFVGGLDSFRNKVMNNFDGSGFDSGEVMKTMVTFIVEKDGTISGIKADGKDVDFNSEAMRTIKSIKGKWVPAKVNGQPVRSYFKFPISMKFDN